MSENNEDIVQYIYNESNKLISKYEVEKILSSNGINFNINNLEIYQQAFPLGLLNTLFFDSF